MAKQLLSDAGYADGIEMPIQVGDLGEVPAVAAIVEQNLAAVGIKTPVSVTPNSDFYGEYWCTGASWGTSPESGGPGRPCGASAADRHRRLRPPPDPGHLLRSRTRHRWGLELLELCLERIRRLTSRTTRAPPM